MVADGGLFNPVPPQVAGVFKRSVRSGRLTLKEGGRAGWGSAGGAGAAFRAVMTQGDSVEFYTWF